MCIRDRSWINGLQESATNNTDIGIRDVIRHEFNGTLSTGDNVRDNIETILSIIPGADLFRNVQGRWTLVVPEYLLSAASQSITVINDSDLDTNIEIQYPDVTDRFNQLEITFANVSQDFAQDSLTYPPESNFGGSLYQTLLAEDLGRTQRDVVQVRGISDEYHAQAFAANTVRLSRRETYSFTMRPRGFLLEPGDIVRLNDTQADIDVFVRVLGISVTTGMMVQVSAIAFDPNDYGWETAPYEALSNTEDFDTAIGTPTMGTPTYEAQERTVSLSWTANTDEDVSVNAYLVQVAEEGASDDADTLDSALTWTEVVTTTQDNLVAAYQVPTLAHVYRFRVLARTRTNRRSPPSASQRLVVSASGLGARVGGTENTNPYFLNEWFRDGEHRPRGYSNLGAGDYPEYVDYDAVPRVIRSGGAGGSALHMEAIRASGSDASYVIEAVVRFTSGEYNVRLGANELDTELPETKTIVAQNGDNNIENAGRTRFTGVGNVDVSVDTDWTTMSVTYRPSETTVRWFSPRLFPIGAAGESGVHLEVREWNVLKVSIDQAQLGTNVLDEDGNVLDDDDVLLSEVRIFEQVSAIQWINFGGGDQISDYSPAQATQTETVNIVDGHGAVVATRTLVATLTASNGNVSVTTGTVDGIQIAATNNNTSHVSVTISDTESDAEISVSARVATPPQN